MSNDEIKASIALLKEQAKAQASVSTSLDGYLNGLKKAKAIQQTINNNEKIKAKFEAEKVKALKSKNTADYKIAVDKLKILEQQTDELKKQGAVLADSLSQVNKGNLVGAKVLGDSVKVFGKLPDLVKNSYGKLKGFGLFDLSKATKQSALQMGLLGDQAKDYGDRIQAVSTSTNEIGIGMEQLAKMQSDYSTELGRTVMLSDKGLKSMGAMAAASGLGAESAAKMAADMDNQGLSAERTKDFVEQTMNDSHKMGLNASKVIKNIQANMKMLNKFNFKGGVKGLAKMAETTTKLGVDMNVVANMADKLFDIEGAVDMSAQLQVMGGAWAKLADPFKLMYMARNDMEGLTEELGKAAEASVHFNKETGEFKISALEMSKLRKVAEQTGVAYDDLATMGKNAAKFTQIKKQMSFKIDKETKEFLSSTAQFNDKGEAYITIKGQPKLLKELTSGDAQLLKGQMLEKKSLEDRAKDARTFDDALTNTINMFKTSMLPIITAINEKLLPKLDGFVKQLKDGKWFDKISLIAGKIGDLISFFGGWVLDNPIKSAFIVGAAKLTGFLFEKASWVTNGMLLAEGFNMGASTGGGSIVSMLTKGLGKTISSLGGGLAKTGGGSMLKGAGIAGGLGIGGAVVGGLTDSMTDPGSAMNILGNAAADAMTGAALGSFLGPIGTAVGGVIGGLYGGISAYNSTPASNSGVHDGLFNKPIHDGSVGKGLGSDFSKDRAIMQGGKITPIDNKDDLLAMKPKGPVDRAMSSSSNLASSMKIEFGEIHFKFDELKVTSPGSPGVAIDLLKDANFIRSITRMVHSETEKVINGGKNKG